MDVTKKYRRKGRRTSATNSALNARKCRIVHVGINKLLLFFNRSQKSRLSYRDVSNWEQGACWVLHSRAWGAPVSPSQGVSTVRVTEVSAERN